MPYEPSWLKRPDYVGAMQSGAAAGIALRRGEQEQAQAADRLRLAYEQLATNERIHAEDEAAKLQLAHASMALRAQQNDALNRYRENTLGARADREARIAEEFGRRQEAIQGRFGEREDRIRDLYQKHQDEINKRVEARDKIAQEREDRIAGLSMEPVDRAMMNAKVTELRGVQKKLLETEPNFGIMHPFGGNRKEIQDLKNRETSLLGELNQYKKGTGALPGVPVGPAAPGIEGVETPTFNPPEGLIPGGGIDMTAPPAPETPPTPQAQWRFDPESRSIVPNQ